MKAILFLFIFLTGCKECSWQVREIKTVGGCNRYGECSVMFTDNTIGYGVYPAVVGAHIEGNVCK